MVLKDAVVGFWEYDGSGVGSSVGFGVGEDVGSGLFGAEKEKKCRENDILFSALGEVTCA